jgi:hypothetical protein
MSQINHLKMGLGKQTPPGSTPKNMDTRSIDQRGEGGRAEGEGVCMLVCMYKHMHVKKYL